MVYTTYNNSSLCRMTPSAAAVEYQSAVGGEANAQVYIIIQCKHFFITAITLHTQVV